MSPQSQSAGLTPLSLLDTHAGAITAFAWSPNGALAATGSLKGELRIWDWRSGKTLEQLTITDGARINCFAWAPSGRMLAVGCDDGQLWLFECETWQPMPIRIASPSSIHSLAWSHQEDLIIAGCREQLVRVWRVASGQILRLCHIHDGWVRKVVLGDTGTVLSTGDDGSIRSWNLATGNVIQAFGKGDELLDLARQPRTSTVAAGGEAGVVRLWDLAQGRELNALEGHTAPIVACEFSCDGALLATKARDGTCRIWRTDHWDTVAILRDETANRARREIAAFHPTELLLALLGPKDNSIRIWKLDGQRLSAGPDQVRYVTAKIALVGDHAVGKTALASRLVSGRFEPAPSTHGQQFWIFDSLGVSPKDDVECEAILWDFAGQPDYRLIHSLFFDDTDVALLLFESSNQLAPLNGVKYWLQQLDVSDQKSCRRILVASQIDRGTAALTEAEITTFRARNDIDAYVATSALTGKGCADLLEAIRRQIDWSAIPRIITTQTFKRIKDYVLRLKAEAPGSEQLVRLDQLRSRLIQDDPGGTEISLQEVTTAVTHLAKHGYVTVLNGSILDDPPGERFVLLNPGNFNNLLASIILEARRNIRGLGAVDEHQLLRGDLKLQELEGFDDSQRKLLLINCVELFLRRRICFRRVARQNQLLVFPGLINMKKPDLSDQVLLDDVSYVVTGAVEQIYAELVVTLGYTNTFTRTDQWQNHARYEVSPGELCGFRLAEEREDEIVLVLQYVESVPEPARELFRTTFEHILASAKARAVRIPACVCPSCKYQPTREEVERHVGARRASFFCSNCGAEVPLPRRVPLGRTTEPSEQSTFEVDTAHRRTVLEASLSFLNAHSKRPSCFISYAWGDASHKSWVVQLTEDLCKANIDVVVDFKDNARIGSSIPRFIERLLECDNVLVIGTPRYKHKYENKGEHGTVVAAEFDLLHKWFLGTEADKAKVRPLLLEGEPRDAFPPFLEGTRVYGDYRDPAQYFAGLLDLVADLHDITRDHPQMREARERVVGSRRPR